MVGLKTYHNLTHVGKNKLTKAALTESSGTSPPILVAFLIIASIPTPSLSDMYTNINL